MPNEFIALMKSCSIVLTQIAYPNTEMSFVCRMLIGSNSLRIIRRWCQQRLQPSLFLSQEVPTTPTKITRDGLFLDDLQTMNHVRYA